MLVENEIVEIIKNYVGYTDRTMADQCLHEVNFKLVAKEIVKKLTKPNVVNSDTIHECHKCMFNNDLGFCPKCDTDCYPQ